MRRSPRRFGLVAGPARILPCDATRATAQLPRARPRPPACRGRRAGPWPGTAVGPVPHGGPSGRGPVAPCSAAGCRAPRV